MLCFCFRKDAQSPSKELSVNLMIFTSKYILCLFHYFQIKFTVGRLVKIYRVHSHKSL